MPRNPDAILIPHDFELGVSNVRRRPLAIKLAFAPTLGSSHVSYSAVPGGCLLLKPTNDPDNPNLETEHHPKDHPRAGQKRHEWFVGKLSDATRTWAPDVPCVGHESESNGVRLGYLLPDPHADPTPEQQAQDYAAHLTRLRNDPKTAERLAAINGEQTPKPSGDDHE